jgi:transcriptional repressor CTCF
MSKTRRVVKVKEENEIQSYINSFKEIEEPEEEPATSDADKKLPEEEFEEIIERDDAGADDEFKYVFIVQDEEEDGTGDKQGDGEEVYEFDEYEEETMEEGDDKSKIVKILSQTVVKKANAQSGMQSSGAVHMCSYCNYSTPKRYLLARHMKCHSEDR